MELIEKALIISLFCVGLRIITSEGMILFFIRKPYEWCQDKLNHYNQLFLQAKRLYRFSQQITYRRTTIKYKLLITILKPIIGCVTCMAGLYTIIIELSYYSISKWTILTIFIVAAFNSIIYALYELISAIIEHYTKTDCK